MTLEEYETWLVEKQWTGYPLHNMLIDARVGHPAALRSLFIITSGLAGEVGETLEHFKKTIRDRATDYDALMCELGDVLAYLTWMTTVAGGSLEYIARLNKEKLLARGKKQ